MCIRDRFASIFSDEEEETCSASLAEKYIQLVRDLELWEEDEDVVPALDLSSSEDKKKILRFSEDIEVIYFDDSFEDRFDHHFREKSHFTRKIQKIGKVLSPILSSKHREKIYTERFKRSLTSEEIQKLAPLKYPKIEKPFRTKGKCNVEDLGEYLVIRKPTRPSRFDPKPRPATRELCTDPKLIKDFTPTFDDLLRNFGS